MARVSLKEATKGLLKEASAVLEKATSIRKDVDDIFNKLQQMNAEFEREEDDILLKSKEQQNNTKILTNLRNDEVESKETVLSKKEHKKITKDDISTDAIGAIGGIQTETINQSDGIVHTEEPTNNSHHSEITNEQTQTDQVEEEPIRPYKGERSYLFISYSHRDTKLVYPIIRHMQSLGLRVWFDEGIVPGKEWDDYVAERVLECDAMIAFISPNYLKSSNCRDELNYARDVEKERLLIYLENVKLTPGMAMRMNRIQAIHQYAYSKQSLFYEKLMECYFVVRNRSFDGE